MIAFFSESLFTKMNKNRFYVYAKYLSDKCSPVLLVFFISFIWFLILTYNFNFFWEDTLLFSEYYNSVENPKHHSLVGLSTRFMDIMNIFKSGTFYDKVSYLGRPLNDFYSTVFAPIFGLDSVVQRIARSSLTGILLVFVFLFTKNFQKENKLLLSQNKHLLNNQNITCVLLLGYFLVIPELWMLTLYLVDSLILVIIFEVVALFLFFFFYNNNAITNKLFLILIFFLIVLFTNISILARHIGRINFLLIFIFLILTDKKKIATLRYGSLIITLFFLSVPVWSLLVAGNTLDDSLGISGHTGGSGITGMFSNILGFLKTIYFSFMPHGFFFFVLLILFFALHIYGYLKSKKRCFVENNVISLKENFLFSFIWFLLLAFSFYVARGFVFEEKSFLRREFIIFIIPQAMFIVSYARFVYSKYFSKKEFVQFIIFLFILLAILSNVLRLNEWRGGWGAYFLGYDSARQFVDDYSNNSILLFPFDHASPTYFNPLKSTNTHAMVLDLNNVSLIRSYAANYSTVYIANREQLFFDSEEVINIANLTIKDNSPYGKIKKTIGKYYKQPMYLYMLKN